MDRSQFSNQRNTSGRHFEKWMQENYTKDELSEHYKELNKISRELWKDSKLRHTGIPPWMRRGDLVQREIPLSANIQQQSDTYDKKFFEQFGEIKPMITQGLEADQLYIKAVAFLKQDDFKHLNDMHKKVIAEVKKKHEALKRDTS